MIPARMVIRITACVLGTLLSSTRADAQTRVSFIPQAGIFLPTSPLGNVEFPAQIQGAESTLMKATLEPGVSLALMAILKSATSAAQYWLELGWVPPVGLDFDNQTSVFTASVFSAAGGIGRELAPGQAVRPFVRLGAGLRSYAIKPDASDGPLLPGGHINPEGVAAFGIRWSIGRVPLQLEASDHLGSLSLDRRQAEAAHAIQNRVIVRMGLRL